MILSDYKANKGQKYLLILIILGLAFPGGISIYYGIKSVIQFFFKQNQHIKLWDISLEMSLTFLALFLLGLWIARAMYKGKVWAHNFWSISGIMLGLLILIGSTFLIGSVPVALFGMYMIIIGGLSSEQKDVKAYLNSIRRDELEDLVDEIGAVDSGGTG